MKLQDGLENLQQCFKEYLAEDEVPKAQTWFFQQLALTAHRFYRGKIQIMPRIPMLSQQWMNVWYTPGVSKISTAIRDNNNLSFELSNRGNLVAIVSDSTRVLGDGNVTPPGGLGVMEGKAFLMKVLGGVDAVPLCIDSRNARGENDPHHIIDFVQRVQHSFGAVNLEDIAQPNCYQVLDELRETCDIPVWHDDQQGTACVILAGLINALRLADKEIGKIKIVFIGAGAANTTSLMMISQAGGDLGRMIMFDSRGSLSRDRSDIRDNPKLYRQWEICQLSNLNHINSIQEAFQGADVCISLSASGPGIIPPELIESMNSKAIVFACANPVPEIYPHEAKAAGAYIVATGRGDFPNQVNNSLCFPGLLRGALSVQAKKITDSMAIVCAQSIADYALREGIHCERILSTMNDLELFAIEAADLGTQAIKEGLARRELTWDQIYKETLKEIEHVQRSMERNFADEAARFLPSAILQELFMEAVKKAKPIEE
jgi:malate dehydrogenase (oxaloacetate-decarboxylating)